MAAMALGVMTFYRNSVVATQLSGELVLLVKVLGGFFHQDAYYSDLGGKVLSDMDVFRQVHVLHNEYERGQLMSDLSVLISKDGAAVVSFWNTHAGCHKYNLEDAAEAHEFLAQFRQYLREHLQLLDVVRYDGEAVSIYEKAL